MVYEFAPPICCLFSAYDIKGEVIKYRQIYFFFIKNGLHCIFSYTLFWIVNLKIGNNNNNKNMESAGSPTTMEQLCISVYTGGNIYIVPSHFVLFSSFQFSHIVISFLFRFAYSLWYGFGLRGFHLLFPSFYISFSYKYFFCSFSIRYTTDTTDWVEHWVSIKHYTHSL